ncbi:MAG: Baseplate wedge protein gp25 [Bacteroidota bacterium]|jgi:phage baseplate assembly protein W
MAIEIGKIPVADLSANAHKVLGIGINRSSQTNGMFPVNYTTLNQAKDNLRSLICTRKGERVMNPTFGCDVWKVIFEPITPDEIETALQDSIISAVEFWLPYISVDDIIFKYDNNDIDNNRIFLDLKFSLKSNPNIRESVQITIDN